MAGPSHVGQSGQYVNLASVRKRKRRSSHADSDYLLLVVVVEAETPCEFAVVFAAQAPSVNAAAARANRVRDLMVFMMYYSFTSVLVLVAVSSRLLAHATTNGNENR